MPIAGSAVSGAYSLVPSGIRFLAYTGVDFVADETRVISLKRHMESQVQDLLAGVLECYGSALVAAGNSAMRSCPALGQDFLQSLLNLREALKKTARLETVRDTETKIEQQFDNWGKQAADYYKQKAVDIREILLILAQSAQLTGERDQRSEAQLRDMVQRLRTIADLDDVTKIRQSLNQSAVDLKTCVDKMAEDGHNSVQQLRERLTSYETRLEHAERLASVDPLTGLVNRSGVERAIETRAAMEQSFSFAMFDLNGFKQINDAYGHLTGDDVLKQFASELRSQFRPTDLVGRWGGDEFVAVLDCTLEEALRRIKRVREWTCGEYTVQAGGATRKVRVDAAVGVAGWRHGVTAEQVFTEADKAMYEDKQRMAKQGPKRAFLPASRR